MSEETPLKENELPRPATVSVPPEIPPAAPATRAITMADIQPDADGKIDWWKPSFADVWKYLPWRFAWALIVLAALAVGTLALMAFGYFGGLFRLVIEMWWQLAGLLLAIVAAGAAVAKKTIYQSRTTPFCIHCGYGLEGLADHYRCPECGRPYSYALIEDYRRDPTWFVLRWKRLKGWVK